MLPSSTTKKDTMTPDNKRILAHAYQSAWYACRGEPIRVSVCQNGGYFSITGEQGHICMMRSHALLMSLAALTEELALNRETIKTEGA
jgi:hypothetical protein